MFNSYHRLSVAMVLADRPEELWDRSRVMSAASVPATAAHNELALMAGLHLLNRIESGRQVYFTVRESDPFWRYIRALSEREAPAQTPSADQLEVVGDA
ncbi:hypothetical protein KSP35_06045 [Aquihabitans sp. G128]|uniref:hypothetical protein n=1 Tax=Aquihabitans sp. G128 TaxID=2849779 RepID=UPI001C21EA2D|nr:hypothetical protein [Aquihabitans sp. G128]QXC62363.1 hypothetical protein KSP35_06045 [Aquihabitans sp. G128]